ncbi:MAG: class II glutamine amidotransferase [Myxococcota bacterium]
MGSVVAVFISDPNLMRCALAKVQALVAPPPGGNAVGLGSYAQEEVLLQRYGGRAAVEPLDELWAGVESEAVLFHAQSLPLGLSLEENTQPFRFRRWLFAHQGAVSGFAAMRERLLAALPDFLRRQIRGDTGSEAAFALFLKLLRDAGRSDDHHLETAIAAQLLGKTTRMLEGLAAESGASGKSVLNFVATNGRMLLATRCGEAPLYYALLEGIDGCVRCGIEPGSPDGQPKVSAHRRLRAVCVASHLAKPNGGWFELPSGTALAVDRQLSVQTLPV